MKTNCIHCGEPVVNTELEKELYEHYKEKRGEVTIFAHAKCEGKKVLNGIRNSKTDQVAAELVKITACIDIKNNFIETEKLISKFKL